MFILILLLIGKFSLSDKSQRFKNSGLVQSEYALIYIRFLDCIWLIKKFPWKI